MTEANEPTQLAAGEAAATGPAVTPTVRPRRGRSVPELAALIAFFVVEVVFFSLKSPYFWHPLSANGLLRLGVCPRAGPRTGRAGRSVPHPCHNRPGRARLTACVADLPARHRRARQGDRGSVERANQSLYRGAAAKVSRLRPSLGDV